MSGKHGPLKRSKYLDIHNRVMDHHRSTGWVIDDDLTIENLEPSEQLPKGGVLISGRIKLRGDIAIDVDKVVAVVSGDPPNEEIQTSSYTYHVVVGGVSHGNVIRYCSPHNDGQGGHHEKHHVHNYDFLNGPTNKADCIDRDEVPTLGDLIKSLEKWADANAETIVSARKAYVSP